MVGDLQEDSWIPTTLPLWDQHRARAVGGADRGYASATKGPAWKSIAPHGKTEFSHLKLQPCLAWVNAIGKGPTRRSPRSAAKCWRAGNRWTAPCEPVQQTPRVAERVVVQRIGGSLRQRRRFIGPHHSTKCFLHSPGKNRISTMCPLIHFHSSGGLQCLMFLCVKIVRVVSPSLKF